MFYFLSRIKRIFADRQLIGGITATGSVLGLRPLLEIEQNELERLGRLECS